MNVIQCPFVKFHVHDDNGYPASGWKLYTFRAGTDEALTAYKDTSGTVEYGAFVLMNSRGEPEGDGIFLEEGVAYKLVLKRPDGSTAWSQPYVLASGSSGGSSVPTLLAARSLYGNTSSSTGEAGAVPIDSALTAGNNSIPSSKAVYDALEAVGTDVVHNSGEQAIDGSLSVSGAVNAGSLSIAGENVDSRFVRVDGHQGQSLVGRSATGSGVVSDVPIAESIDGETNGSSVPTVAAVRGVLSSLDDGLVKTNVSDTAGYLSGKVVGDGNTADVALVENKLVVSVDSQLVARIGANDGLSMVNADDSMGYLADKVEAGPGVSVEVTESNKLKVTNTLPDTMMTKAHALSSVPGFISSLMQAGTGINLALSADMEKIVLNATGSAVGGFYWKGTWSTEGTYNVNNAVWYFDHTGELPVSRLYIATTQNQGINPFTDAGIGTGTCWSCMMAVDYMGDQFVMLDASDTQAGYLSDKLKAGQYVTLTRTADANGAWYTVDCAAPYTVKTNGTTKTYADMDGKIEIVGTGGTTTYWYGTQLMVQSITLGDGYTNAYPGDKGKIAYTHSQAAHAPANADNTQATLNAGASKTTPVDADTLAMLDSAASNSIKKLTWANVKATLKAYLDGVYEPKLTAGDTAKYYRGDKTWQDMAGAVRSTVLTGLASGTNAAIAATDTVLGGLAQLQAQISASLSTLNSHTGRTDNPHSVTKAQVGLGNVDNTKDLDKPVSTATSSAISTASTADRNRANHTGTQAASTISDFASSVRSTVLTGLASGTNAAIAATDTLLGGLAKLQAQITASLSTLNSHTGRTDNPHSVTKAQVGLGNVDNTKDLDKPVSTATSSAISTASTADRNRANHTGTQAASTISDFAATVLSTVLTGLASGTNAAIAATDTLLGGLAKLQAQLNSKQSTLTFDGAPTDGSSHPVTSNGIYAALAGKANAEANSSGWITFTNSTGAIQWLDGFYMSCPIAAGVKNYCNQILEIECSQGPNALLQHYTQAYMHMNAQGTSVTFRAETEGDFTYGEIFARHDNGGTAAYLTFDVKLPPYATVRIRRVMADGSAGSAYGTSASVLTAPVGYAFEVPRRNGVNIRGGDPVTLPAYASVGTTVFVDGTDTGWSGVTVNAPGGTSIYRNGYPTSASSVDIGAYSGRWFVKTDSTRWRVDM